MSDYSKTTNFGAKDALPTGNAAKVIKGSEHDTEYDNIATAVATKANKVSSPTDTRIITMDANGDLQDGGNATLTGGNMDVGGNVDVTGSVTAGSLVSDTLTAETTNGNLALDGNGTGVVTTDAIQATTTNGDLALDGNGTGGVTIESIPFSNLQGQGGIGSFAILRHSIANTALTLDTDYSGANLRHVDFRVPTVGGAVDYGGGTGSTPSGTWKCLQQSSGPGAANYAVALFVRIS